MTFTLIVDLIVAVLLVFTIGYAMALNRRLRDFRREKSELEKLAASFGRATSRAQESLGKLRNTADALQERIEKAESLRDDLAFLFERSNTAADRLEDVVRAARKTSQPTTKPTTKPARADEGTAAPARGKRAKSRADAELRLMRALRGAR